MKTNIQKGKKVASAMLAGVLAMGMCVPAVSFSAFTSPEVAVAVEGSEYTYTIEQVYNNHEGLLNLSVENGALKVSADNSLGNQGGGSYIVPCLVASPETNLENEATAESVSMTSPGVYYVKIAWSTLGMIDANACPLVETDGGWEENKYPYDTLNMACYKVTVTDLSAAPVVLNRSLDVTKESAQGGVLAVENTDSVKVEYAAAPTGVDTLKVGDKTAALTAADGVSSAAVSIADLGEGTYPVAVYEAATPTNIDIEGTLTVTEAGKVTLSLTSPEKVAKGTSYTAIKVFDADITGKYGDENAPKGTNIQFANGVNADVIKAAGDPDFAEGVDAAHQDLTNAQNAAEYLNANIAHQPGVGLTADSYGISLAKRLMAAGADTKTIVADGDKVQLDGEGYYLIVRTSDLTGENTAATSPIFAALDEGDTEITLKVAIPTITKQIQEDGDNSAVDDTDVWGDEADHTLNQDVNYRLIGTIADNVDAFATYEYNFKDSWDAAKLALHADSVKVVVKTADTTNEAGETVPGTETDITDAVKALTNGIKTDEAGKLEVNITDLKAIYPALTATDQVIVSYTAEQCGATATPEGIVNTAFLEYSNNPVFASKGTTPEVSVKDYSYALRIHKVDNSTKEDLAGVEFSIKNSAGKFLALVDGEVVEQDAEYAWTTDAQGRIMIDGVDADTYTVAETKALDAYDELGKDITMTINAADRDGVVGSISSESALVGEDTGAADKNDVVAQVLVNNVKQIPLPSTGELGLGLVIFLAVAAGFYAVSRRRKQEETRTLVI